MSEHDLFAIAQSKANEARGRALELGKYERDTVLTLCDAFDALGEIVASLEARLGELSDDGAKQREFTGDVRLVHILKHGAAMCGLAGVPRDWPDGHRWVSFERVGQTADDRRKLCANCAREWARGPK